MSLDRRVCITRGALTIRSIVLILIVLILIALVSIALVMGSALISKQDQPRLGQARRLGVEGVGACARKRRIRHAKPH
jgi:hypothetical protein